MLRTPLALALLGWLLVAAGYLAAGFGFFGGSRTATTLGTLLVVAGAGAHVAALVRDLRLGRAARPLPYLGVANALAVALVGLWFWGGAQPIDTAPLDVSAVRLDEGRVVVAFPDGPWAVPLDACGPPPTPTPELRSHGDVVEVAEGARARPFLTLRKTGRRVECPE